jgi:hypothetical protein
MCWVALATAAVAAQPEVIAARPRAVFVADALLDLLGDPSASGARRVAPSLLKPPFGRDQWPTCRRLQRS